ncbi:MAG: hypothetical protein Q9190_003515 [Brigantiaea leucoxantha]
MSGNVLRDNVYDSLLKFYTYAYNDFKGSYHTGRPTSKEASRSSPTPDISAIETEMAPGSRIPYSPSSYQNPSLTEASVPSSPGATSRPDTRQAGLSLCSFKEVSELSGESTPTAEVSLNLERSMINDPLRVSRSSYRSMFGDGNPSLPQPSSDKDATLTFPNLMTVQDGERRRHRHVMSWMEYDCGEAGPNA